MSKPTEEPSPADGKKSKKRLLIIILIAVLAIGAGAGGTWYAMKMSGDEGAEPPKPKEKPTAFVNLDMFTVNLQPEDSGQFLQVGLTVKTRESPVGAAIAKQMPEIRNRILMLLSSKKAADVAGIVGKQQLSQQITEEIKQSMGSDELKEDVLEVLFTSFVIQ